MTIKNRIQQITKDIFPVLVKIRRFLHQNPELSFQEFQTTQYLRSWLQKTGLQIFENYADTGVVGLLEGKNLSSVVALRGDIDALPIEEKTGLPFSSKNHGIMHACGHDLHATVVVGAALILSELKNELEGSVKFILQPGEEKNPGGASIMIKNGVLKDPPVDIIFGLHSDPGLRVGEIGYKYGTMMAEPDEFYIKIKGKSGHASSPHLTVDPIVVASEVVLALQKISSRLIAPLDHVVVSVGKISGGNTTNVIPDEVELAGTVRTFNHQLAKDVKRLMKKILAGITSAYDADFELNFDFGYPVLVNEKSATDFLVSSANIYFGKKSCREIKNQSFGGEDFAYYLQKVKGSFFRLGSGNPEKNIISYWHNSSYDVDENAIISGAGFMAFLAYDYLKKQGE